MTILGSRNVVVVAAHPDDEVIGCGGTIARLAAAGASVRVLLLADGIESRHPSGTLTAGHAAAHAELDARRAAARASVKALGATAIEFGEFPDNRMDTVSLLDVVQTIERVLHQHRPDTVLTHHAGDVNVDHQRVHDAVIAACRPQPGHFVRTLLFFEVASSTEWQPPGSAPAFAPNCFVDIAAFLETRRRALEAYHAEMRPWPHPRSYEALDHLARWRGATVGFEAAEAFMVGRHLEPA